MRGEERSGPPGNRREASITFETWRGSHPGRDGAARQLLLMEPEQSKTPEPGPKGQTTTIRQ